LTILSEDKDYNNKAVETLTIIGQGDDLKIGFNARFLNELLSNLESESIDRNVTTKSWYNNRELRMKMNQY
jgi:DNA polymerase III sliding clamp (beta) subunit (PCNA family)